MNAMGIVLVMCLLSGMVVLGAVMAAFCLRRLRQILAGADFSMQVLPLSLHCFPLALGMLFVVYGIAGINKVVGFGDMLTGTVQVFIVILAQSIPAVLIFLGAYLLLTRGQRAG